MAARAPELKFPSAECWKNAKRAFTREFGRSAVFAPIGNVRPEWLETSDTPSVARAIGKILFLRTDQCKRCAVGHGPFKRAHISGVVLVAHC